MQLVLAPLAEALRSDRSAIARLQALAPLARCTAASGLQLSNELQPLSGLGIGERITAFDIRLRASLVPSHVASLEEPLALEAAIR